jgi:hypothetical protein
VGEVLVDADLGEGGPWRLGSWVEPSSLRITTIAHKIYGITPERERDATKKRLNSASWDSAYIALQISPSRQI